ncbi:Spc98 family-domain-containing protein [Epithele typhae]|uniref:Spc98 family-domain-containing protein n=1 Tax=Epithele typhae TaxID=378194 RepID=UPI00200764F8|nr:Spc98 family-domain-containing protein [Epithele typhae]KAH9915464.1 Spc98 family-domain-containing protein [Epithele typhae]
MDPYTPRVRTGSRKKNLTLSAKEYHRITDTIASVRRQRQYTDDGFDEEAEIDVRVHVSRENGARRGTRHSEVSFEAERSFVRAPLNSRVVSSSGPRDKASARGKGKGKGKESSLSGVPIDIQEALVLEDLLFVLMGIEGTYITYHPDYSADEDDPLNGVRFVVSPTLDPSLRDLVERILPLATYYTAISSFIELRSHLDFGLVNHALCASMRDMLKDYQTLLSQLEHAFNTSPQFTLQKLWFYVHPTLHTLSLLYMLTTDLATADDPSVELSDSNSDESDAEEAARNEALGLGSASLKAVLSEIKTTALGVDGGASGIAVKGGEVLAILHERMQNMSGDPAAHALYGALLRDAGRPYVEMAMAWIRSGKLDDSYEEFLVKESKFINRGTLEMDYTDEYWERRYTLRDGSTLGSSKQHQAGVPPARSAGGRLPGGACVPAVLERWKHKILLAGKYLNVIRECGIEIRRDASQDNDDDFSMDDERFHKSIEDAYTHANRTLLQLLLRDQQLIPRLRSVKRYFFLSQSSFLTHLLDLSHTELRKSAKSASLVKLQSLLDLALNTDAQGEDAMFREDVKVTMASSGLYEWLLTVVNVSGLEDGEVPDAHAQAAESQKKEKDDKKQMLAIDALTLDYHVKFPLSLVISRKTILRYQLIFRFLLHLKHVEQSLSSMWIEHKTAPWRKQTRPRPLTSGAGRQTSQPPSAHPEPKDWHSEFESWRKRVFLLRARMLAFVQQILAFTTFEVLEPNWRKLEGKLEAGKVETVDQLLRDHVDFLDTCLKECMLTSSKLLRAYSRLIVTCSTFALYTASFTKSANNAIAAADTPDGDHSMAKRWDILGKFETNFNHWFKVHLDCVQFYASSENVSLLPLVVRLNSIKAVH